MKISAARIAAFEILLRIERDRAFSSILLPEHEQTLSEKDRGLCHRLVLGVLRRQLYLDVIIEEFSGGRKLDSEVRIALRLGLFQLFELERIPDHSAVNESVLLVQRAKKTSAKGFVNALLRRAASEKVELNFKTDVERISVETSHPEWLIERWAKQFGRERAESIARSNNVIPKLGFRRTLKGANELLPQDAEPSEFIKNAFVVERNSAELRDLAENGFIYFQDEASQMVGRAVQIPERGSFLDVCAAPGSKTTLIAATYENARIVAGDLHEKRVKFLRANCIGQGVGNVNVARYDAETALPFSDETFNTVLVNAPCSGTGTIRSNPEIRYFLSEDDFTPLQTKQLQILTNASKTVKRGGDLVYSTCSLEFEENEAVIEGFLRSNPEFAVGECRVPDRFLSETGFARTFPDRDGMDGFFIATMTRA